MIRPEDQAGRSYEIGDEVTVGPGRRAAGFRSTTTPTRPTCTPACSVWTASCGPRISGSTNGTWVNTVRIGERTRLEKGDLLQIGGTVFEVGK